MNKYIKIVSPFIFLLSFILILSFKSTPSGKLWKDYSILYVPKECDDSLVMNALGSAEIKDVVSLSGQYLPVSLSENSIEISMMRLNYDSPDFNYLKKRSSFFFDKSAAYRLYYIPSEYKSKISNAIHIIETAGIPCGTDSNSSYPWLLPLIAVLLAGMLFLFCKNKFPYLCGIIIPLLFLYANPFYPVALATCLILLSIFLGTNLWKRKGAVQRVLYKGLIPFMIAISFICAFSGSVRSGFLFIIAAFGTAGALFSFYYAEEFLRTRKSFVPVFIRPAKRIPIFAGKAFTTMSVTTAAAILLLAVFLLTSSDSIRSKVSKLLLPASTSYESEELPQLEDFYRWNWNLKTYPYISLNDGSAVIKNGIESVEFEHYTENEASGLLELKTEIISYDQDFKDSVYTGIDLLKFNSLEKVMKSEGQNFTAGFTASNSYHVSLFGIIMCFICLFILLFIYFSIIIRKGINK